MLVERFVAACERGDMDELVGLLVEDAAFYADSGGKAPAPPRPVFGRENVVKLLRGLLNRARQRDLRIELARVNGQAGGIVLDPEGNVVNVVSFDVRDGRITTMWSVANPDKLRHPTRG